jgi:hypothetical protein
VSCEHVRELLEAYALGILDQDEKARVESHLSYCANCRARVAEYTEILARLPDALALASPLQLPLTMKQRLLAAIEAGKAEPAADPRSATVRRGPRRAMRLLVLAGVISLFGALASTAALSFALDRERQLKERFAGLLDQREIVLEIVDGRGTERLFLRSADRSSSAYGKLFTNPRLNDVVVMAGRLPPAEEGERYRVLLTSGGVTRSPGILSVNAKGFGLLVFGSARAGPNYDSVRIVLEHADARLGEGETVLTSSGERS